MIRRNTKPDTTNTNKLGGYGLTPENTSTSIAESEVKEAKTPENNSLTTTLNDAIIAKF
ncbi:MAG: hypothetical protein RLZZ210_1066 [Pseudomonadota bacterium]|jgi:hypothetical protein